MGILELAEEFLHETVWKTCSVFRFRAIFQRNQYQYQRGEIALTSLAASDTVGELQTGLVSAGHLAGYGSGSKCLRADSWPVNTVPLKMY